MLFYGLTQQSTNNNNEYNENDVVGIMIMSIKGF